jgi:hypothetical protein
MWVVIDIFPLLAIPLLIYNFVVLTGISGQGDQVQSWLAGAVFTIHSFSGDQWALSTGDILIVFGVALLFIEIVKSTRTDSLSLINHGIAALVFVVFLVEFLTIRGFTTSVFFILMMMQLVDVIAGYTVTAVAAKRDFGGGGPGIIGTH